MIRKIAVMAAVLIAAHITASYADASGASGLQYAPKMRYADKIITYRINDCPRYKWVDIEKAFNKISGLTPLMFLPVAVDEQMIVNCSPDLDKAVEGDKYGVRELGKGGPRYSIGEKYNIIVKGEVLIEKDHDCEEPLVEVHEILHAMGYVHSSDKTNIMYPMLDCAQEIKGETIDDITALYLDTALPDLELKKVTLKRDGAMYVVTMEIFNNGITESRKAKLVIRDGSKRGVIKAIDFPVVKPGAGVVQTFSTSAETFAVDVEIETEFEEIRKDNNKGSAELR